MPPRLERRGYRRDDPQGIDGARVQNLAVEQQRRQWKLFHRQLVEHRGVGGPHGGIAHVTVAHRDQRTVESLEGCGDRRGCLRRRQAWPSAMATADVVRLAVDVQCVLLHSVSSSTAL